MRVLCVRIQPEDVAVAAKQQLEEIFGVGLIFEYVNPHTPEQLDEMTASIDVVAVYLQERPLPTLVVARQEVPCVLLGPDNNLVRLLALQAETAPFTLED